MFEQLSERAAHGLRKRSGSSSKTIQVVRAPLRICPVGAHVDHQAGRLIGMAIDRALWLAFVPNGERRVRLYSRCFDEQVELDLAGPLGPASGHWADFLKGAVWALRGQGVAVEQGWDGYLDSNTPIGGLSSSAASGLAFLTAFQVAGGRPWSREENVQMHYRLERQYVGVKVGLNDPTMISHSIQGHVVHLDCLTDEWRHLAWGGARQDTWCLLFSGVGRSLTGTPYNRRVEECLEAAARLVESSGVKTEAQLALGRIPQDVFDAYAGRLPENLRRRAEHYYSEVERVDRAAEAWTAGDTAALGRLMNESCESSIQSYQSGAPPLIELARIARQAPGCCGCRFSGGGFGGFCIALVDSERVEETLAYIEREYKARQPQYAQHYQALKCRDANGLELLEVR